MSEAAPKVTPFDRRERRRRRMRGIVLRSAVLLCASAPLLLTLAPDVGRISDVIAGFAAQWALMTLLCALIAAALRTWVTGLALAAIASLYLVALVPGRAQQAPAAVADAEPLRVVRVLHMNAKSTNARSAELFAFILQTDADVVSLVEPPTELVHRIRDSAEVAARYAPFYIVPTAKAGWPLVLSRWEQRGGPDWEAGPLARTSPQGGEGYVMRIEHPTTPFFMLQAHVLSPRSGSRWSAGNEVVARLARRVRTELEPYGLPIILACDLNSSPSGWRSRRITSDSELRRCKPLLKAHGTYPAWSFWPLSVAIDDCFVSPDVRVADWSTLEIPGSDHHAVLVRLLMPE